MQTPLVTISRNDEGTDYSRRRVVTSCAVKAGQLLIEEAPLYYTNTINFGGSHPFTAPVTLPKHLAHELIRFPTLGMLITALSTNPEPVIQDVEWFSDYTVFHPSLVDTKLATDIPNVVESLLDHIPGARKPAVRSKKRMQNITTFMKIVSSYGINVHTSIFGQRYGRAFYPTMSLANHSCDPSVAQTFVAGMNMQIYARRDLVAGEEVTVSYHGMQHASCLEAHPVMYDMDIPFDRCLCQRCAIFRTNKRRGETDGRVTSTHNFLEPGAMWKVVIADRGKIIEKMFERLIVNVGGDKECADTLRLMTALRKVSTDDDLEVIADKTPTYTCILMLSAIREVLMAAIFEPEVSCIGPAIDLAEKMLTVAIPKVPTKLREERWPTLVSFSAFIRALSLTLKVYEKGGDFSDAVSEYAIAIHSLMRRIGDGIVAETGCDNSTALTSMRFEFGVFNVQRWFAPMFDIIGDDLERILRISED